MTDHKALYGSQMNWDLQKRKQRAVARERDARIHGKIINRDDKTND